MSSTPVDRVVRSFDAARTRRQGLAALLGSLSGLLVTAGLDSAAARGKKGRRDRRKKDRKRDRRPCGTGRKEGKECRCKTQGTACANDAQCCPKTKGLSCQDGTCQPCNVCRSGCEFSSVQEAIKTLAPASAIHICAGTFGERLTITSDVTLVGVGDVADGTVIDGLQQDTTVTITDATVTFERLRITGGANPGGTGGGIRAQDSLLTLTACTVSGNTAADGAGICLIDSSLALNDSRVTGNRATASGGGISKQNGAMTLNNSEITDNEAGSDGGGIAHKGGATTFNSGIVRGNEAAGRGGGILFDGGAMTVFEGARVEANTAGTEGGGIFRVTGSISVFGTVTGNTPDNCQGNVGNCTNS